MSEPTGILVPSATIFNQLAHRVDKIESRLSALEAKQQPEPSQPSGSLVERVRERYQTAFQDAIDIGRQPAHYDGLDAAIEAVADWLDDAGEPGAYFDPAAAAIRAELKGGI